MYSHDPLPRQGFIQPLPHYLSGDQGSGILLNLDSVELLLIVLKYFIVPLECMVKGRCRLQTT